MISLPVVKFPKLRLRSLLTTAYTPNMWRRAAFIIIVGASGVYVLLPTAIGLLSRSNIFISSYRQPRREREDTHIDILHYLRASRTPLYAPFRHSLMIEEGAEMVSLYYGHTLHAPRNYTPELRHAISHAATGQIYIAISFLAEKLAASRAPVARALLTDIDVAPFLFIITFAALDRNYYLSLRLH